MTTYNPSKTWPEYHKEMWVEFEGRIPASLSKKVCSICAVCEEGWEPTTYDKYDSKKGWSYKTCEPKDAYFVRNTKTGKQYRWNQKSWILKHTLSIKVGEI